MRSELLALPRAVAVLGHVRYKCLWAKCGRGATYTGLTMGGERVYCCTPHARHANPGADLK